MSMNVGNVQPMFVKGAQGEYVNIRHITALNPAGGNVWQANTVGDEGPHTLTGDQVAQIVNYVA